MSGQYPYAPPPPPPSAAPVSNYSPYGQQPYSPAPRGGGAGASGASGRGRGYSQAPSRADYGPPYGHYAQQDYSAHNAGSYGHQPSNGYWSSSPAAPHSSAPLPQNNYHPNYAPQGYPPHPPSFQPAGYPAGSQRPAYTPTYSSATPEYSAQQWGESGSPYSPYPSRGGRGGYSGDRGGHRPETRIGYDQSSAQPTQASNGYGQQYPPQHQAAAAYPPYSNYPPAAPPYPAPSPSYSHGSYNNNNRGRGRDGFSGHSRGRGGHHNDRAGDKFRHKGQRPPNHHENNNTQKSEAPSGKKKKRKTNTLGLTPGDGEESDKESVDEETRLAKVLGTDAPVVADLAAYLAERRANYPTKARVKARLEAEAAKRAEVGEEPKPVKKLDKDEEKAEKLRKQLAKVERRMEKRKRETNDEGDEMRVDDEDSDSSSSSDDDPPESQTTKKPTSFLPPPPITRADPTSHCKYYSTGGQCGKKGKCRFVHDPEVRERALQEQAANGGRMTLKQRLLRNEKEIEDLDIIRSIVSLRQRGIMPQATKPAASTSGSLSRTGPTLNPDFSSRQTKTENSSSEAVVPTTHPVLPLNDISVDVDELRGMYGNLSAGFRTPSTLAVKFQTLEFLADERQREGKHRTRGETPPARPSS